MTFRLNDLFRIVGKKIDGRIFENKDLTASEK